MAGYRMTVSGVQQEGVDMRHLTLESGASYPFGYGQYTEVGLPGEKPGYFAIASSPESPNRLGFLVKDGKGASHDLYGAKVGDEIAVGAPMGPGFPQQDLLGKNLLLIGVGSGMAPLRSVIGSVMANRQQYGERVMLIYGARTPFHIPFRPEIAGWRGQMEVYKAMSQPGEGDWDGYVGYVQHLIEDIDVPRADTLACICGMSPMVDAVKAKLAEMGIAEDDVYLNF